MLFPAITCINFTGDAGDQPTTNPNPMTSIMAPGGGAAQLDISELDKTGCSLYQAGLAPSTQRVYLAGNKIF